MDVLANDVAIAIVFAMTGWMLKAWLGHRERMGGLALAKQGATAADQRLARVEQAVEAIAIEVERISEGQRYVTKVLGERADPVLAGAPGPTPRLATPH